MDTVEITGVRAVGITGKGKTELVGKIEGVTGVEKKN